MKNKFLALPDSTRINVFTQTAEKRGMTPFVVEKDWWVVQTLKAIFDMEVAEHLVFKGGTSLSKAWQLIERFSEDIDLAIEREFLGFDGKLSNPKKTKLRKASGRYISDHFFPELQKKFEERGLLNVEFSLQEAKDSDQDPRIINLNYPNIIEIPGYLAPRVQVEIGCRSLIEPYTLRKIASMVDEEYAVHEFSENAVEVPSVDPERTFLEKIFLLHEEFQKPEEKIRVDRLSRHLYDLFSLSKTEFAENALQDKKLYEMIVQHRQEFTKISGVHYTLHNPATINPIPPAKKLELWEKDYEKMREEMIYGEEKPTFAEILETINNLKERINKLDWKII